MSVHASFYLVPTILTIQPKKLLKQKVLLFIHDFWHSRILNLSMINISTHVFKSIFAKPFPKVFIFPYFLYLKFWRLPMISFRWDNIYISLCCSLYTFLSTYRISYLCGYLYSCLCGCLCGGSTALGVTFSSFSKWPFFQVRAFKPLKNSLC